jgi:two-component system, chemotaxis family, sensor kinase CheA
MQLAVNLFHQITEKSLNHRRLGMDSLDQEMKMSFIDEARQLLEAAEQCFLDLENARGNPEIIETIFRLAHNMKGTSRAVGFGEVAQFTHNLENLLLKIKEGKLAIDKETVDLLLACNDHLKMMVNGLSANMDAKFDSSELIDDIVTKIEGGSIARGAVSEEPAKQPTKQTDDQTGSQAEAGPELSAELSGEIPAETSGESVVGQSEWAVPNHQVAPQMAPQMASPAASQAPSQSPSHPGSSDAPKSSAPVAVDETIRVSLSRLEKLGDFIGELVILQTVLNQHRVEIQSPLLQRTVQQLSKISKEIQDISMSLRMIPLKQTFAKLQRIVRDTSKALDKVVVLELVGEQTEVDKTILEQVSDPLVHIVRNAIDHGLESAEDRIRADKPAHGKIEIHAFHQGNNLVIEVVDDGGGIDPKKLIKKAAEKNLISPNAVISDEEAFQLIFHPGFSTKDQVSEISGRGVGLDVVKTNVTKVGGDIQIESEVGVGTCFRILLPLTLAIIDGMIVQVGEERYVVPIANVQETVQPKKEDISFVTNKGEMLNLREATLPLVRLSTILRQSPSKNQREAWNSIAIVVNSRRAPFAILVDDILRQQQIVIKKLGSEIRVQKGLAGSAILGDGKPALILDLNDLMEQWMGVSGRGSSGPRSIAV